MPTSVLSIPSWRFLHARLDRLRHSQALKTKEKKPRPPPTGRKALPKHLPLDTHSLKPNECAHCGSTALDVADVVEEEKLDVVNEHQRRRVVKRTT